MRGPVEELAWQVCPNGHGEIDGHFFLRPRSNWRVPCSANIDRAVSPQTFPEADTIQIRQLTLRSLTILNRAALLILR